MLQRRKFEKTIRFHFERDLQRIQHPKQLGCRKNERYRYIEIVIHRKALDKRFIEEVLNPLQIDQKTKLVRLCQNTWKIVEVTHNGFTHLHYLSSAHRLG